jgi:transcriptional regulator with XRE-family HTH domain
MTIREEIKKLLAQSGLTQYKFCKVNGIVRTNFAAYLRGKDTLSAKKLDYILDALRRATPSTTLGDCSDILSPEILEAAGWQKVPSELKQIEYDKLEELDDGTINCFSVIFRPTINRIAVDYSDGETSIHIVKPQPLTVEEFNKLLDIARLQRFKIKPQPLTVEEFNKLELHDFKD